MFTIIGQQTRWPFLFALDAKYREIGWVLVNGPIVTGAQNQQFAELRRAGYRFIGMSSYLTFPAGYDDDPLDYEAVCEAWCHCFRRPERFLRTPMPRALISVSDFTDYQRVSPRTVPPIAPDDRVDFVYVGAVEDWKREAKNWQLAARCVPRLCGELGLRALVIGASTNEFTPSENMTFKAHLPWHELLARLARARFLFVPSVIDASPRVIAEALCLDVPVVVHRDILGGWKYINRFTGVLFDGEHDLLAAARRVCAAAVAPRDWFRSNYGVFIAGRRLLAFLRSLDAAVSEREFLRLSEPAAEMPLGT